MLNAESRSGRSPPGTGAGGGGEKAAPADAEPNEAPPDGEPKAAPADGEAKLADGDPNEGLSGRPLIGGAKSGTEPSGFDAP
jgi:hypothetical protein